MVTTKQCKKCGKNRSIVHFYKRTETSYRSECKTCWNKKVAKWTRNNKDKRRRIALAWYYKKRKEGSPEFIVKMKIATSKMHARRYKHTPCITPVEEIIKQYTTDCEVCGTSVGFRIHLDHCHSTGKFRGFLCAQCNQALGSAAESVQLLEGLIAYLKKHSQ